MAELMSFNRRANESIDALLTRFATVQHRAQEGGTGMALSQEGYTWILLRACGINQQQLLQLLQPFQGRFLNSDVDFQALSLAVRRMGHVLEGAAGNIAGQLRQPPGGPMSAGPAGSHLAYPTIASGGFQLDPRMQAGGDP